LSRDSSSIISYGVVDTGREQGRMAAAIQHAAIKRVSTIHHAFIHSSGLGGWCCGCAWRMACGAWRMAYGVWRIIALPPIVSNNMYNQNQVEGDNQVEENITPANTHAQTQKVGFVATSQHE
jgi:hypothetical protein